MMRIVSSAFENNTKIPSKYTCDGENVNPPLSFLDIPANTKSLVLIMDDPDAPMGTFVHWVLFNLNPKTSEIKENSIPQSAALGKTSVGKAGYVGPCPPSGTHRYFFKLFAINKVLPLTSDVEKQTVEEAMKDSILDKAEIIGLYSREY